MFLVKVLIVVTGLLYTEGRILPKTDKDTQIDGYNIIGVPAGCPAGYKADANGTCRPIWFLVRNLDNSYSVITAPPNCPPGQRPDPLGVCRPEWYAVQAGPMSIITAPTNCPPGYKPDPNGVCRPDWGFSVERVKVQDDFDAEILSPGLVAELPKAQEDVFIPGVTGEKNILRLPTGCPNGQSLNSQGRCKTFF